MPQEFALGFYPIAETAASRWGDASIAVEPLSDENLAWALQNGRMVFLASHGGSTVGSISMSPDPYDNFYPEEIPEIGGTGPDLQFVYIAGCDAGRRNDAWQRYLGPAKLVTFDRFSWVIEHVYWLWFQGPAVVNELR